VAPAAAPGKLAPELAPDSELEPELPVEPEPELPEPEPMFGHGCFAGEVDFWEGVVAVGVDVVGAVDWVLVAALVVVLGAAAAPGIPETAPPVASAPATIVAPRILDMVMLSNLLGVDRLLWRPSSVPRLSGRVGSPKRDQIRS
jgi:hypothetical protein